MTASVRPLQPSDRAAWEPLWAAYQRFYEVVIPPETTDLTWARFHDPDEPMHALGAFDDDGRLVGIVHAIFHRSCWLPQWTCYLQDLYVKDSQRGLGTGAVLIDAVADLARANGAGRLYWMTHETNAAARQLYDRVAERSGFIQYRKAL
ncbi:GNAT family N-acetyltransferase [Rhizobium bangladeshense]|uniref:GNAT family N-acetyltransferase n=1 Tax=Rhizobium bangladeshense TaxID=1138189 RepID=UPI001C82BE9F|nr:GNAT family N-acetyltransferase [Rhizobium bangladeshense]MBX4898113.1 GNAT family N-acetyltransferase [Rhizobium bangladeshense]MBX4902024.1 GNAT family N-acetyltransferase [Rhizobium bangladeshense]MBX4913186.1 GNAT family N-acetyltransferase [Rhizobium bangladeshense]MBY3615535.1 GNAT family N-acetyltransferase [Rhizobium bangladeshense]